MTDFGGRPDEGRARMRAIIQAVADLVRPGDPAGLRALDLGAGDGRIAAELALRGASVVAVEGRRANADAIVALREQSGIPAERLDVQVDDVRALDWQALGTFDVVVCSGLLYHLELRDAIALVSAIRGACTRLAVIDTEVAWGALERRDGYSGHAFREHVTGATAADREASRLASLDNDESFWLTRTSLHALLQDAGFSSSWELGAPGQPRRTTRATVAAVAGERVESLALEPDTALSDARPIEPDPARVDRARLALARLRARARR